MKRAALAAVVAALIAVAAGCDKTDKFTRDCHAKGGHVVTSTKHGARTKVCVPPTGGGWQ